MNRRLILEELKKMSGKRASNSRPAAWEAAALPTELLPQIYQTKIKARSLKKINIERKKAVYLVSVYII